MATNKPEDVTRRLLDVRGLSVSGRVRVQRLAAGAAALQGRDAGPAHGTPRRGAGTAIMVGDSALDMRGGQEAGMPRLLPVGYGRRGRCSKPA
ncbi:MAG: hypothetical protein ACLR0N_09740 [Bilophila wadsworthia]